jgi:hypothetical protein
MLNPINEYFNSYFQEWQKQSDRLINLLSDCECLKRTGYLERELARISKMEAEIEVRKKLVREIQQTGTK